jgi:hypothetical protein
MEGLAYRVSQRLGLKFGAVNLTIRGHVASKLIKHHVHGE